MTFFQLHIKENLCDSQLLSYKIQFLISSVIFTVASIGTKKLWILLLSLLPKVKFVVAIFMIYIQKKKNRYLTSVY